MALATDQASSAILYIPHITVSGGHVFTGPSFVVNGNFTADDVVDARASGTVDLAFGFGGFFANAAGVIVAPLTTNTGHHPGQTAPGPNSAPYAALLIGNSSLGFHPLFAASVDNGLGNSAPPLTVFAHHRRLGDIFGAQFTSLTSGTTLNLRVNDINIEGNTGSFVVSTVPEPATAAMLSAGMLFLRRLSRRGQRS